MCAILQRKRLAAFGLSYENVLWLFWTAILHLKLCSRWCERAPEISGLALGMSRLQAESFDGISASSRVKQQEDSAFLILMNCGERISPRIEVLASPEESSSGATLILDVSASERLLGTPEQIAIALQRNMDAAGFMTCVSQLPLCSYAAVLAAGGFVRITIIPPGERSNQTLAPLPHSSGTRTGAA